MGLVRRPCASLLLIALVTVVGLAACTTRGTPTINPNDVRSIRVASSNVKTNDGTNHPKVTLSIYEDFLCPACGQFESKFGSDIHQLIKTGTVAVDYYMVAILDGQRNQNYSSRAGGAAYCVADEDSTPAKEAFQRFHAALYAQQPSEAGSSFPTNSDLIETARQAGPVGSVPECVKSGRYSALSSGLAKATGVNATPTIRINGENYEYSTPEALVAKAESMAR
jgi:protein-disulfide isomerase